MGSVAASTLMSRLTPVWEMVCGGARFTATPVSVIGLIGMASADGVVVITIELLKISAVAGLNLTGKVQDPPDCPSVPARSAPLKQAVRSPVENPRVGLPRGNARDCLLYTSDAADE